MAFPMEKTQLQLEYLKEQYAQARQHETLRTNATAFLTAAAGVFFGLIVKDGKLTPQFWWAGLIVALIGVANLWINKAHFRGNRLHTAIAGKTRRAIEDGIEGWTTKDKPTQLRSEALEEHGLKGSDISVGGIVHAAVQLIPIGVVLLGLGLAAVLGWELLSKPG
jgi:hypothetical protein